jgi:hypothetical protein
VGLQVELARGFGHGPAHEPGGGFEHGDVFTGGPRSGGDLQADEPATHDDEVLGGSETLGECFGVVGVSEVGDAGELRTLEGDGARARPGGERQTGEAQRAA